MSAREGFQALILDRPPLNILTTEYLSQLLDRLRELRKDALNHHGLVMSARGKVFSAGVDVAAHLGPAAEEMLRRFHEVARILYDWPALTVSAVHGNALGGGCELALCCDVVLASDGAAFAQPEVTVGVFPPVAAVLLPPLIGAKRALNFLLSGEAVPARTAEAWGMVSEVLPAAEFEAGLDRALRTFARHSRSTLRLTRQAARAAGDGFDGRLKEAEELYLKTLMATQDASEGLRAFLEKRPPAWRHG